MYNTALKTSPLAVGSLQFYIFITISCSQESNNRGKTTSNDGYYYGYFGSGDIRKVVINLLLRVFPCVSGSCCNRQTIVFFVYFCVCCGSFCIQLLLKVGMVCLIQLFFMSETFL